VDKYARNDSLYPKDIKKRAVVNQMLYFDATTMYHRILNYYVSNVQKLLKNQWLIYKYIFILLLQPTNSQIYRAFHNVLRNFKHL
jgi:hypothetical protein